MVYKVNSTKLYSWIYEYFQDNPLPEDCPVSKAELLGRLGTQINAIRKASEKEKLNRNPLREEILRVLEGTTEQNPMTAQEIWDKSPVLQQERQVMGVTNLLKKLVTDGVVIKMPRLDCRYLVKYYINPDYNNEE